MFFVYRLNSDFKSFVYYCLLHDYSVYPFTVVLYASLISFRLTIVKVRNKLLSDTFMDFDTTV